MGLRYVLFRLLFEAKRKSGILKWSFPTKVRVMQFRSHLEWTSSSKPYFFDSRSDIAQFGKANSSLAKKASDIRSGRFIFFSGVEYNLGKDYDWMTNPETGFKYPRSVHWLSINDFSEISGDIKYVWEKSRFSYVYTLVRDEFHNGNEHGTFIFDEIISWIDSNPVNCGPNWKCSQEISLRVLNWIFVLYFYKDKGFPTEEHWQKILNSIYWQIDHVYRNINFSKIAVRNNHAITECLALYIVGTLFPDFKKCTIWRQHGKKWLEDEVVFQVYDDGSYIQYSMNYHRVLLQLLTCAISFGILNGDNFSSLFQEKSFKALNFAFQCQDEITGWLPNYGANDGALFFHLNDLNFRDFRPQINALHFVLTGKSAYQASGDWEEDANWFGSKLKGGLGFPPIFKKYGIVSFPDGGYYLIRKKDCFTFFRCGSHLNRPSQADNLHIDIWYKGKNILIDAGSYKYNTDIKTVKYFMGTESHNTIMIGNNDQMVKGARFIWYNWTKALSVEIIEDETCFRIKGRIKAFKNLSKNIIVFRELCVSKSSYKWEVYDEIFNYNGYELMRQLWHVNKCDDTDVQILPDPSINCDLVNETGWSSSIYGSKTESAQLVIETKERFIRTNIFIS